MRNLGPACEKDLHAVGIDTAEKVKQLGAEEVYVRMLLGRIEQGRSVTCCNASYLYAIYGAIHDIDWRAIPKEKKIEFKAFAAELRESGSFNKSK